MTTVNTAVLQGNLLCPPPTPAGPRTGDWTQDLSPEQVLKSFVSCPSLFVSMLLRQGFTNFACIGLELVILLPLPPS
jgi:hypothetical protein